MRLIIFSSYLWCSN